MRKFGLREVIPVVPMTIVFTAAVQLDAKPTEFVFFSLGVAAIAGISLWAHTIRYEVQKD